MGLLTAKIFVLHSGYASVADNNFKDDNRIKKIITLQIQNELIPYTLFGTLPSYAIFYFFPDINIQIMQNKKRVFFAEHPLGL